MAPSQRSATAATHGNECPSEHRRNHAVVAWFSSDRGFGQLETDDGELVFVGQREILCEGFRDVAEGQRVTFIRGRDDHGPVARQVVIAEQRAVASGRVHPIEEFSTGDTQSAPGQLPTETQPAGDSEAMAS